MRIAILTIAAAAAALAGAAQAQSSGRLSDGQYLELARCAGLADGAGQSVESVDQALRAARRGRADHVREQAINARSQAASEFRRASGEQAAALNAELAACR